MDKHVLTSYPISYVVQTIRKRLLPTAANELCINPPALILERLSPKMNVEYFALRYHANSPSKTWGYEIIDGVARSMKSVDWNIHPLAPSIFALRKCNEFGDSNDLVLLRRHAEALDEMIDDRGQVRYQKVMSTWGVTAPMASGLSQGFALSLAVRIYRLSGLASDHKYARMLAEAMLISIENGGPLRNTPLGPVLEEYPGSQVFPAVLNGWLTALIGLLEYVEQFPNELNEEVTLCYNAFRSTLPQFLQKYGHRYSLGSSRLSGGEYPMLVCFQLVHLAQITNLKEWKILAQDWAKFIHWPFSENHFHAAGAKDKLYAEF